jgi:3-phosphoglycerate kinase
MLLSACLQAFPAWRSSPLVRSGPSRRTPLRQVVLASHFGRPQPAKESREQMLSHSSLRPVADVLAAELGPSAFTGLAPDCVGTETEALVTALQPGQVCAVRRTSRGVQHNIA